MPNTLQDGANETLDKQQDELLNGHLEGLLYDSTRVMASSSLGSEEGTDVDSPSFSSSLISFPPMSSLSGITPSPAAKAREKVLRDDDMAIVLGPLYVDCKGCGKRIKLSTKSLYDLSHWRTHRTRCLKRQPHLLKKPTSKPDLGTSEPSLRRSEKPGTPLNPPDADKSRARANTELNRLSFSKLSVPSSTVTLPSADGTTHNEDSGSFAKSSAVLHPVTAGLDMTNFEESDPAEDRPTSSLKASTSRLLPADVVFADYLLRSNRQMVLSTSTSTTEPRWQDWNWARLRLPRFQASDHEHQTDELFPNDATLSLSVLAHS